MEEKIEEKPDPDVVFNKLMNTPEGWRKVASCMVNPIRLKLKDLYAYEMTKEQEYIIYAEVYKAHLLRAATFNYKEALRMEDRLVGEFKGNKTIIS
jgi:hypothetical protein